MPSILDTIPVSPIPLPSLPEALRGLDELASNLYWTWRPDAQDLFQRIDPALWKAGAGPIRVLRETSRLEAFASEARNVSDAQEVIASFQRYMREVGPEWPPASRISPDRPIAYFCAEYAFHASMNQYAGGLGILAGDHVKEASDLRLPFISIGLFYRRGFFHQLIDWEGRQEHIYDACDPENLSLRRVLKPGTQKPLRLSVPMPEREVHAAVWLATVGRAPLLLLDTDIPENAPEDRFITSQLYTNGREMRFCQEMMLGIGGVRVLRALGITPSAWHLNEGHSAMLLLERLRESRENGLSTVDARTTVREDSIITIHTPVPEGNERFGARMAGAMVSPLLAGSGIDPTDILEAGLGADADPHVFDMTAFAIRYTHAANGVSRLHGQTANRTWSSIAGFPVQGITNGIHMPSWIGPEMRVLLTRAGANFKSGTDTGADEKNDRPSWNAIHSCDSAELWNAHMAQKDRLIAYARERLVAQHARHGEGPDTLRELGGALDSHSFIIGFARRFATYKRASLLFSDEERLIQILNRPGMPVQILFAGKAHPSDRGGQALIENIYRKTRTDAFRNKVFVLEDYDVELGGRLSQGADVWLNNPRRPLEASGTSGMKAAVNGVPNLSILDGWWDEAFVDGNARNGWAIGSRDVPEDTEEQDLQDAESLYRLLEEDVIPCYFRRDGDDVPLDWIHVMKEAISTSLYAYSTRRMLRDYVERML